MTDLNLAAHKLELLAQICETSFSDVVESLTVCIHLQ